MSLFDKAKKAIIDNKDKVEDGLEKAESLAKDKLPDKYDDKIGMAADKAKDALKKLD